MRLSAQAAGVLSLDRAMRLLGESPTDSDTQEASIASSEAGRPFNVIFDTDIWSDIDDALALAMLHAFHDRREVNLAAVTISTENKWCASYVDLIDTFYNHPQIPIGIVRNGIDSKRFYSRLAESKSSVKFLGENYTQLLSERKQPDGTLTYPHRLIDGDQAQEAVSLLRKTLSALPDASVVMIQVGFSTNFARLLESAPDSVSPLSGRDLIGKKVRLLSAMAGNYGTAGCNGTAEFNLMMDVPSAQKVFSGWPTPVVASGGEIGAAMLFPASSIEHDFSYVENHPIAETYRSYSVEATFKVGNEEHKVSVKWPHDHASFDLTAVLYAVRPDGNYFSLSKPGRISVKPDGSACFDESESGTHRFLILTNEQKARTLEAMIMLASQPPVGLRQCSTKS